ncbi:hypothetical protein LINGRAPRIM_LOCUS2305 [Linum grandiflorum]
MVVMQGSHQMEDSMSELGILYRSIRGLLDKFGSGLWQHDRREVNEAAHIMAHSNAYWNSPIVWMDRPSIFLVDQFKPANVTIF